MTQVTAERDIVGHGQRHARRLAQATVWHVPYMVYHGALYSVCVLCTRQIVHVGHTTRAWAAVARGALMGEVT